MNRSEIFSIALKRSSQFVKLTRNNGNDFWQSVYAGETRDIKSAFASTTTRITAMPGDVAVPVEWTFTNHWDFPMLVEKFDQSCGCLSGKMNPQGDEAVAPGKTGTIRAAFTAGAYRGLVRKFLHVSFVGYEGSVELVAEAKVPSSVEVSPRDLVWTSDKPVATQWVDVTSGTGQPFHITELTGISKSQFQVATEVVDTETHYRVGITPTDEVRAGNQSLIIRTDSKDPRDRVIAVFLNHPGADANEGTPVSPQANRAAP